MDQTYDVLPEFAFEGAMPTRNGTAVAAPTAGGRRARTSGGNANAATGGRGGVAKRNTPVAAAAAQNLTRGQKAAQTRRANAEKAAKDAAREARAAKRAAKRADAEKAAKRAARAAKRAANKAAINSNR